MANEAEKSLDLQHQEAHVDDGIFTQLLETRCLYISVTSWWMRKPSHNDVRPILNLYYKEWEMCVR